MRIVSTILGLLIGFALCLLIGNYQPPVANYTDLHPAIDIQMFDGHYQGHGVVQNWYGKVVERFTANIDGKWQAERGTITIVVNFTSSEQLKRTLNVTRHNDHHFTVDADDISGVGLGKQYGSALELLYDWQANIKGKPTPVTARDNLFMLDNTHLLNLTTLARFGLPIARITTFIQPGHTKAPEVREEQPIIEESKPVILDADEE